MVLPPKEVTIGPKMVDCIFIGYALNSGAYKFVVHKAEISTITVVTTIESRNVVFLENTFPCKDKEEVTISSETRIEDEVTSSKTLDEATSSTSVDEEPKSRKLVRPDPSDAVLRRGNRSEHQKHLIMTTLLLCWMKSQRQ